jgi:predicted amino acid-binding ACT domain protein
VVFVAPIKGKKQAAAATSAGFSAAGSLHSVRIEGPDKAGLGASLAAALASAGVNLRGLSAAAIGKRMVCYLALDSAEDAKRAAAVVRKMK